MNASFPQGSSHPTAARIDRNTVAANLFTLQSILQKNGLNDEAQKVQDKIRDFSAPNELLVFVFGEGNFGKSSLINALTGRDIAPVSFLPKTWKIDVYRGVVREKDEHALVRRKGQNPSWCSVSDAEKQCSEQEQKLSSLEKELLTSENAKRESAGLPPWTKSNLFDHVDVPVLDDQIIEVQWFRAGLALPSNIALVDTPGFSQVRTGMNAARTKTLGGSTGIVIELQELYENFIHRANLVLWAFRADKLNDADTVTVFNELQNRNKEILGVITYADKVAPERRATDLLSRAKYHFGHGVTGFVPVVCGGSSPEKGLGIAEIRQCFADLSPRAEQIKMSETATFCRVQADFAQQHLSAIGETLIYNVTQISLYCNATSERLLSEMNSRIQATYNAYLENIKSPKASEEAFYTSQVRPIAAILNGLANHDSIRFSVFGVSSEKSNALANVFRQEISSLLRYELLNTNLRTDLERTGEHVRTQGSSIAAGRRMRQVVLKSGGRSETRSLNVRIEPPDVSDIRISLPHISMPPLPGGFVNNVARVFGGVEVEASVVVATMCEVWEQAQKIMQAFYECSVSYTKRAAEAILKSADDALREVYPEDTFASLAKQAEQLDRDLSDLDDFITDQGRSGYRFLTQFRIWSPRDDVRVAALDLFCEWFSREWPALKETVSATMKPALLSDYPLDTNTIRKAFSSTLARNKISSSWKGEPVRLLLGRSPKINDALVKRRNRMSQKIASIPAFAQAEEKSLLKDFEYLSLEGVPMDIAQYIAECFAKTDKQNCDAHQIPAFDSQVQNSIPLWKQLGIIGFSCTIVGATTAFATAPVLPNVVQTGAPHLLYMILEPALFLAISGPLCFKVLRMIQDHEHRGDIATQISAHLNTCVQADAHASVRTALDSLTDADVRNIVGRKTLIQKRPLDYAIEGAFDEYKGK